MLAALFAKGAFAASDEFFCHACSGLAGGQDLTPMSLGLSHSLSRYKLKFSPDKVSATSAKCYCRRACPGSFRTDLNIANFPGRWTP